MITRVLSTILILDLRISRIKEDERDVKLLREMLENHYRYPFVFDAGDLYSNEAVRVSGKEVIFKADQNLLDCSDKTTEYERGFTIFPRTLSMGSSSSRGLAKRTRKAALPNKIEKLAGNRS